MRFDRQKFFSGVRDFLKSEGKTLTQKRTDALEFLISSFEKINWPITWISYAFATLAHETAWTFEPIKEYRAKAGTKGRANQDRYWLSGYYGRGYVQLTWRKNYELFGLADNPDKALEPATAFRVLVDGMSGGLFTTKKLSDYISDTGKDYKNARKIINGTDQAAKIANYAVQFENILRASKTSTAALPASKPDHDTENPTVTSGDNPTAGQPSIDFTGGAAIVHPVGDAPPSLVAVQTPVVEVEQVKPEQESVIDTTITKWSARFVAVPTALLSFLGGVWAWMTNSPTELVMTLIIAGAVVAVIYFVGKMFVSALDKARQDRLQAAREQRAHEIQKLTLESAMHKDLNTVRVVPQPLLNSDNPANEVAQ